MRIKSPVTGKTYDPADGCVYITNMLQVQRMLNKIGPDDLLDVLWSSEKRPNSLVFVWSKTEATRECKKLWDNHEL